MESLRRRLSAKLIDSGAALALERRDMVSRAARDQRRPDPRLVQVMDMIDVLSALKIRLGVLLMPARLP